MILAVDLDGNAAIIDGRRLRLTPMQAEMLHVLHARHGATVTHATMIERLYGARPACDIPDDPLASIKVTMLYMRRLLASHGVIIEAVWGKGWRLEI